MSKYIIDIPDEVPVSDELVPFDMCRPSWYWEAYKEGKTVAEDEVWDFVRIITDMTDLERKDCFGNSTCDLDEYLTYQEAKEKYEAWKKQKDRIRIGDEVKWIYNTGKLYKGIVLAAVADEYNNWAVFTENGCIEMFEEDDLIKTGRHSDIVEEMLKKITEESNED